MLQRYGSVNLNGWFKSRFMFFCAVLKVNLIRNLRFGILAENGSCLKINNLSKMNLFMLSCYFVWIYFHHTKKLTGYVK